MDSENLSSTNKGYISYMLYWIQSFKFMHTGKLKLQIVQRYCDHNESILGGMKWHGSGHSTGRHAFVKITNDLYGLTQSAGQSGQLRLRPERVSLLWNKNKDTYLHVESIEHVSRRSNVHMLINALKI